MNVTEATLDRGIMFLGSAAIIGWTAGLGIFGVAFLLAVWYAMVAESHLPAIICAAFLLSPLALTLVWGVLSWGALRGGETSPYAGRFSAELVGQAAEAPYFVSGVLPVGCHMGIVGLQSRLNSFAKSIHLVGRGMNHEAQRHTEEGELLFKVNVIEICPSVGAR